MYRYNFLGDLSHFKFNKSLVILYITGFVLAVATNTTAYINSSFLETFIDLRHTSLFFVAANIVTFFAMLFFSKLIKKNGNLATAKMMIIIGILSLLGLIGGFSPWLLLLFFVSIWASFNLLWINMDIFVESFTTNANTGKTRAVFFTFMNIGWIFAPIISTRLVVNDNYYNYVYLFSAAVLIFFYLLINLFKKKISKDITFNKKSLRQIMIDFWHNKNLKGLYMVSFFLNLFFGVVVVYIPLYLHSYIGFDWPTLGLIFSFMLIPFILIEIPAGIIADKYIGEKEMLFAGLGILTLCLFLFGSVKSSSPLVWGVLLFFSRIGAALVEAMRESRFFKIIDAEDVGHINFLRSTYPLGYLVGASLGAIILTWYSIPFLLILLSVLFLFSFYFVYIIKDSK
jgi:MFS family permease